MQVYYYFSSEVFNILRDLKNDKLDRELYDLYYHAPIIAYHGSLIGLIGFKTKLGNEFDSAFYKKVELSYEK